MDEQLTFSLSYEQLFEETEAQIKKCDLSKEGPYYPENLNKAMDFLSFWNRLAHRGYSDVGDYERIDADFKRLHALVFKRED
ncbi:hypothetical protein HG702_22715 (plasmid) [Pectobacterium versatile]|nr:hypothetical protein HG702_22715 [Pectobacterium versatile]